MKLNGKKIMSIALIGLLCTAIYMNWNHNSKAENEDLAKVLGEAAYVNNDVKLEEPDMFSDKRIERQTAKEQALELIEQILSDESCDKETRTKAQTEKLTIAENLIKETDCETVLVAKGFENILVTLNADSATVIVQSSTLIPTQIVQIQEVVSSSTGISPEKIKIVLSR